MVKHYGLEPKDLKLKVAHLLVEPDHRKDAYEMILPYLQSKENLFKAYHIVQEGLQLWTDYQNGIAQACGLGPEYRKVFVKK